MKRLFDSSLEASRVLIIVLGIFLVTTLKRSMGRSTFQALWRDRLKPPFIGKNLKRESRIPLLQTSGKICGYNGLALQVIISPSSTRDHEGAAKPLQVGKEARFSMQVHSELPFLLRQRQQSSAVALVSGLSFCDTIYYLQATANKLYTVSPL